MTGIEKITARLSADCDEELAALRAETEAKCMGLPLATILYPPNQLINCCIFMQMKKQM